MNSKRYCPLAGKCGGCRFVNETYEDELFEKYLIADKWLKRFGKVMPFVKAENPMGYRCKVQATCGYDRNGRFITGQYKTGSHILVPVNSCPLEDPRATEILSAIRGFANKYRITAYNEDTGKGDLRHVLIRLGYHTDEIMVVLIVGKPDFKSENNLVDGLVGKFPQIKSIVEIVNNRKTNMVIPPEAEETVLFGDGYIYDRICGLDFSISAKSFYQVNPAQAEVLYNIALDFADLRKSDTVIDAYCGTGTIGLIAAFRGIRNLVGIESNSQAVEDAFFNAKINKIRNADFVCADASKELKRMKSNHERCDILFLDPPRNGSSEEFLASAAKLNPDAIIYISCNPETLSRDLRYVIHFTPYRAKAIQPVDMFPGCENIECVVLLVPEEKSDEPIY